MSERRRSSVLNAHTTPFLEYDLEGPVQPEMSWLPVSYDAATGQGCYLMRMQPGAVTIAHDHPFMEEFLILEGRPRRLRRRGLRPGRLRLVRGGHASQLVDAKAVA